MGWVLTGLLLVLVIAEAMPSGEGEVVRDTDRHNILQALPKWLSEVRAAVVTGIICAGMSPDMVWVVWGHLTRTTGEDRINLPET